MFWSCSPRFHAMRVLQAHPILAAIWKEFFATPSHFRNRKGVAPRFRLEVSREFFDLFNGFGKEGCHILLAFHLFRVP